MIIDTNHRTTAKLSCLSGAGVTAIIRYYARTTQQPEKRLIRSEAEAILNAGMSLAIVHQAAVTFVSRSPGSFRQLRTRRNVDAGQHWAQAV